MKDQAELKLNELYSFERDLVGNKDISIAGVDEAGRGPLAGPVVAAAVILKKCDGLFGVDDSKKLTSAKRKTLFDFLIHSEHVLFGVGIVDHEIIDEINILESTHLAMRKAIEQLSVLPDCLLIDGLALPQNNQDTALSRKVLSKYCFDSTWKTVSLFGGKSIPQKKIIKGDAKSLSIASASIIAKETRDALMSQYEIEYPGYGLAKHKGYGTSAHMTAIKKLGPCAIHRKTFAPMRQMLTQLKLDI